MKTLAKLTVVIMVLMLALLISLPVAAGEKISAENLPMLVDAGPEPEFPLSSVAEGAEPFVATPPDEFVVGEMLIKFKDHVSPDDADIAAIKKEFAVELKNTHKLIGVHLFKLKTAKTKEDTLKAIKKFKDHPLVEFAEPNGIVHAIPIAEGSAAASDVEAALWLNDPYLASQYGLDRIFAFDAWNLTMGDPWYYSVAILDTGVNSMHPDLQGKISIPADRYGNCISPWTHPMDDNGHGTHVAGIASASGGNGVGIAGVAPRQWRILSAKVLNAVGEGTWDSVACGINMAAVIPSVKAINLSIGGTGGSSTLYNAVYNAWVNYGKTVVAANGNIDPLAPVPSPYSYPACYSLNGIAIAVGATDFNNNRAPYSRANNCITVSAPGTSIYSTYSINYSTANDYAYQTGTSMASPHVAGTVMLMDHYSRMNYWPWTNNTFRQLLMHTAQNLGSPSWDIYSGWGLINAYGAVRGGSGVNALQPGESLAPGQARTSSDGRFTFIYQGDGNLVLYQNGVGALWWSGTQGAPGVTVMQTDGNLVVYNAGGQPVWHSVTFNNPNAWLVVQNDGNVVVYGVNGLPLWATNTCCR